MYHRRPYDIAIFVPLKEEREILTTLFSLRSGEIHEGISYNTLELSGLNLSIVAVFLGEPGSTRASGLIREALKHLNPKLAVLVGIAGILDKELKLGDVVVASRADEFLAGTKLTLQKSSSVGSRPLPALLHSGETLSTSPDVVEYVRNFDVLNEKLFNSWLNDARDFKNNLGLNDEQLRMANQFPKIVIGHVASAPSVDDIAAEKIVMEEAKPVDRKFKAIENEAAGFLEAAKWFSAVKTLIIRGLSDIPGKKSRLDSIGRGAWRRYAMYNASSFLAALLKARSFQELIASEELPLVEADNLFRELAKSKDIPAMLGSNYMKENVTKILESIRKHERSQFINELEWAIRVTMENSQPELLEKVGANNALVLRSLAAANHLPFYTDFVTAFAFQKMGFENQDQMVARISEWHPYTLTRDEYAMGVLKSYPNPEKCFVLSVTFAKWMDPTARLRETICGSKETKLLLMSPFAEDRTYSLFQEEHDAPIKPVRFRSSWYADWFRRLCAITKNLSALSGLEREFKVQVRFYRDYKPPIRFTLMPGKVAVIFPTPFRVAGDLYTFCAKVTDKAMLQGLEDKYEGIWKSPTRTVDLSKSELDSLTTNALYSLSNLLKQKNATGIIGELKNWAKESGHLEMTLANQLEGMLSS